MSDHADIVREALTSAMCGGGEDEQVAALAALDALVAENAALRVAAQAVVEAWPGFGAEDIAAQSGTQLGAILLCRAAVAANTTAKEPA